MTTEPEAGAATSLIALLCRGRRRWVIRAGYPSHHRRSHPLLVGSEDPVPAASDPGHEVLAAYGLPGVHHKVLESSYSLGRSVSS
jgi:hypothetical protein